MIIIEKPYVSEFLVDSIVKNNWLVLDNEAVEMSDIEDGAFRTIHPMTAKEYLMNEDYPLIYSNSENSINWILTALPDSNIARYIRLFKDKFAFRNMLSGIYPDFKYKEVFYHDLEKISLEDLQFPLVLKPSIGFLSLGVHTIHDDKDWKTTLFSLEDEIKSAKALYPDVVIDASKFIIEEYVSGEEYAIDAYYDDKGNPVILNIFHHPFLDTKDVRDRMYMTSAGIMIKYMARLAMLLKQIGEINDIRNFPLHLEVRITDDDKIIPIEVNPMRFAGWCTTDIAKYAWGVNVYECFMNRLRPDWNNILSNAKRGVYYFSMAEVPIGQDRSKIKGFDYEKYLANFSNVLELRRINPKKNPLFAVVFGFTEDREEIKNILSLKTKDYTIFS